MSQPADKGAGRVVVAAIGTDADDAATLRISRSHLAAGAEVVHLGARLDPEVVAAVAVAEDAVLVVLVEAGRERGQEVGAALARLGAQDVDVVTG